MTKKINLGYSKDRLVKATLLLGQEVVDILDLSEEKRKICLDYKDGTITLSKAGEDNIVQEKKESDKENNILSYFTVKEVLVEKVKKKKGETINFKLSIPFFLLNDLGVSKENRKVEVIVNDFDVNIKKYETSVTLEKEQSMERNATIITFKVNKGGVGKTFLTSQIGTSLCSLRKKVLILTSDSQNNILDFLYEGNADFKKGLKAEVKKKGDGENFILRKTKEGGELHFIPLEDNKFATSFSKQFETWIEEVKKEYDFILIDSVPTMKIDETFLKISDKIIIPAFCDKVTIKGVINLLKEVDLNKVYAICINKYSNTQVQNKFLEEIKTAVKDTHIILPEPIPNLSFVEKMIDKKKSIWEYKNQSTNKIKRILVELLSDLL